jgi:lipoprotein-anchoring transpeptidase ErfK/SrfK
METKMRKLDNNTRIHIKVNKKARFLATIAWMIASNTLAIGVGLSTTSGQSEAREFVPFPLTYASGTIIIKQSERRLYLTTGPGTAVSYPIAIGRAGMAWQGNTYVQGKYIRPA